MGKYIRLYSHFNLNKSPYKMLFQFSNMDMEDMEEEANEILI